MTGRRFCLYLFIAAIAFQTSLGSANDFVLVPAGSFQMGDAFSEGAPDERPVHSVNVSAFFIGKHEVSREVWDGVTAWAVSHGYSGLNAGSARGPDHPASLMSGDVFAWCNARSEMEGRVPCYLKANGELYQGGGSPSTCRWDVNGYRLPTEAEWEKAARGGTSGTRFSWGDTISHSNANYTSVGPYAVPFETSPYTGIWVMSHPLYRKDDSSGTAPVGSFAPNGYGLYDTVGNLEELCWDWYSETYYSVSPADDPTGPSSGTFRVKRGGSHQDWSSNFMVSRASGPANALTGFRLARSFVGISPPAVSSSAPTAITPTRVRLHGVVNPGGGPTVAVLEYGVSASYGQTVSLTLSMNDDTADQVVFADLSGLQPSHTYHYRLTATNSEGAASTTDGTFTTFSPKTVPLAWGLNTGGQLGNGGTAQSNVPAAVDTTGVLAGKTVVGMAAGSTHTLAVCSDGTVAAWGMNTSGQLGNGTTTQSRVPVAVSTAGALAGKTVIAVAAGQNHSLALCSDGAVAAWGINGAGQLGNNSTTNSSVPVLANGGALAGKRVLAIGCGGFHSVALCADGTVATWGLGTLGRLGHNSTESSLVPVAVYTEGVLSGKTVTAIAVGYQSTLALCSDGKVVGWGENGGRLGNGGTAASVAPVEAGGALTGKRVIRISMGGSHSLALCSDGTLCSWGSNVAGQMGVGSATASSVLPLTVPATGALAGKSISFIQAGQLHSLALCSDSTLLAWGSNLFGQLGDDSTTDRFAPTVIDISDLGYGRKLGAIGGGNGSYSLGIVNAPPSLIVFIPGIAGSVLKGNAGLLPRETLWPTTSKSDIRHLNLRSGGATDVEAVDIVRWAFGVAAFYGPFIEEHLVDTRGYKEYALEEKSSRLTSTHMLDQAVEHPGEAKPTLFTFPYDWRKSNASQTATLHQYIQHISALHGGAKVSIVTHSMGGLVLRRYLLDYGAEKLDKVVTIACPFWGAPQAVYRMMTGVFFDFPGVDFFTADAMKESLVTLRGAQELLPSNLYLQHAGMPVLSEDGWDFDNSKSTWESYTPAYFWEVFDRKVLEIERESNADLPYDVPSSANALFHTARQDSSHGDGAADPPLTIPTLHLFGQQDIDETPVAVVAKARAVTRYDRAGLPYESTNIHRLETVSGPGDGTVPLLSAQRLSSYVWPGAATTPVPIPGQDEASHNGLMKNPLVWYYVDDFLDDGLLNQSAPTPAAGEAPMAAASEGGTTTRKRLVILGSGYVKVKDSQGNQNTKEGDATALKIPNVDIQYGGEQGWVIIECGADIQLIIEPESASDSLELEVTELDATGAASSLERFRLAPHSAAWRLDMSSAGDASLKLDQNDNGTMEPTEEVPPMHQSAGGAVDLTQPKVTLEFSVNEEGIVATVTGTDEGPAANPPALFYCLDGGSVEPYTSPLQLLKTADRVLKVFAEDAAGNTSGLIETTIHPEVAITVGSQQMLHLSWPVADAYVLEESASLDGDWIESSAPVTRSGFAESAAVPVGGETRKFFRLRSRTVSR